tara:strand:- start:939 stop:1400 length:462 start_codon:yes stop_codon:yes gene_type:complete
MRLTIIREDKTVIKDGVGYIVDNLNWLDSKIHAVQWDTDKGEIEYGDGSENTAITDITPYNQSLIDWETAKDKEAADEAVTDETWEKWFRDTRNDLLFASDWTQLSDAPLSDAKKTEWKTYRQALRDLPTTKTATYQELVENMGHSDYPTKPS